MSNYNSVYREYIRKSIRENIHEFLKIINKYLLQFSYFTDQKIDCHFSRHLDMMANFLIFIEQDMRYPKFSPSDIEVHLDCTLYHISNIRLCIDFMRQHSIKIQHELVDSVYSSNHSPPFMKYSHRVGELDIEFLELIVDIDIDPNE